MQYKFVSTNKLTLINFNIYINNFYFISLMKNDKIESRTFYGFI